MKCRYCDQDKKLINAHIIPERFFDELKTGPGPLKEYSSRPEEFPKKSQLGVYDQTILCLECEQELAPYDNYAFEVFLSDRFKKSEIKDEEELLGYTLEGIDYPRLKLFFLSLIWRASVSTHPYYKEVRLGPYESVIRGMLKTKDPGKSSRFPVMLGEGIFPNNMPSMLQPYTSRYAEDKRFCYVIPFGRHKAFIVVDGQPIENNPLILHPGLQLTIMYEEWNFTTDAKYMRRLLEIDVQRKNKKTLK